MGYFGLDSLVESDCASGMAEAVLNAAAKELSKELKNTDRGYNTPGCVNVALFFEECFVRSDDPCIFSNEKLKSVARRAKKQLDKLISQISTSKPDEWHRSSDRRMHLTAYRRMHRSLGRFLVSDEDVP